MKDHKFDGWWYRGRELRDGQWYHIYVHDESGDEAAVRDLSTPPRPSNKKKDYN